MLNRREIRTLQSKVKKNPAKSAPDLATELSLMGQKTVNPKNVRRKLRSNGYYARISRHKPSISKINAKAP